MQLCLKAWSQERSLPTLRQRRRTAASRPGTSEVSLPDLVPQAGPGSTGRVSASLDDHERVSVPFRAEGQMALIVPTQATDFLTVRRGPGPAEPKLLLTPPFFNSGHDADCSCFRRPIYHFNDKTVMADAERQKYRRKRFLGARSWSDSAPML